jgi:Flp pilus assembly protein TadB
MKNIFSQKKQLQDSIDEIEAIRAHLLQVASRNARDNMLHFWVALLLCVPVAVVTGIINLWYGPVWIAVLWFVTAALWLHTVWSRFRAARLWRGVVVDAEEE